MIAEMARAGYLTCALPFNHMMSLYMACGELERVPEMIKDLRRYTLPDLVTYNIWLTYCSKKDSVKNAEKVFDLMRGDKVVPDWMTFSLMASIYINAGLHVKGRDALVEMEKRASRNERAAYSSLLTLYASLQDRGHVTTEMYNSVLRTYAQAELMPLIIDERMDQDKVAMDEETRRLLRLTSKYPIGEASTLMS
ncbi:hypothetical protein PR202_ga12289 [Eleusine coracana subsp. coracana]|uniref:Pentatricopeptide repeat-containing protein n=1 Tax=Eleusine coracana subsp. coracana TaxID=191504 RepID=A0AAV5CB75_ELECO|nr:hypothetical protein PR202_ga12289 [Eleusine coracana subsp. coracana]